jgi:hypothetical protein
MAYQGSTAASSVSNPPLNLIAPLSYAGFSTALSTGINMGSTQIGTTLFSLPGRAAGGSLWRYASTDGTTAVCAQGYFTDGLKLGMQPGDAIIIIACSSLGGAANIGLGVIGDVTSTGASIGVAGSSKSVLLSSLS